MIDFVTKLAVGKNHFKNVDGFIQFHFYLQMLC